MRRSVMVIFAFGDKVDGHRCLGFNPTNPVVFPFRRLNPEAQKYARFFLEQDTLDQQDQMKRGGALFLLTFIGDDSSVSFVDDYIQKWLRSPAYNQPLTNRSLSMSLGIFAGSALSRDLEGARAFTEKYAQLDSWIVAEEKGHPTRMELEYAERNCRYFVKNAFVYSRADFLRPFWSQTRPSNNRPLIEVHRVADMEALPYCYYTELMKPRPAPTGKWEGYFEARFKERADKIDALIAKADAQPPVPGEPKVVIGPKESPPEPERSPLEEAFLSAENQIDAFQVLQDAFDAAKAGEDRHADDYPLIITLCAQLKEKWPITSHAVSSMKLAARCWIQLGEAQKALEVYVASAEYEGELEKQALLRDGKSLDQAEARKIKIVSRDLLIEANGFFQAEDYVQALNLCDLIMTPYPMQDEGFEAMRLVGMYSFEHKQYDEAIRTFKQVIETGPDSHAAYVARMTLPLAFIKAKRRTEASQTYLAYAQEAKTEEKVAQYTCQAGLALSRGNEEEEAQAVLLLEKVINDYPDQKQWVARAQSGLNSLRARSSKRKANADDSADTLNNAE